MLKTTYALLIGGIMLPFLVHAHPMMNPEEVEDYDTCVLEFLSEAQDVSAGEKIKQTCASQFRSNRLIPDKKIEAYNLCLLRYLPRSESMDKTNELINRCKSKYLE